VADREIRYRASLDASGFRRGSREISRESDSLGRKTSGLIGTMGDLANATGITAGELLSAAGDMLRMGAAAEVTAESFKRTFGPAAEELDARLGDLALSVGVTGSEMRAMLTPTGQLLQSFGLTATESAEFSAQMFESAAALAAFAPSVGSADDAMASLGGALRGEFDSLEKWGVGIKQADVNLRALEQTGKDSVDQLSKEELALAALSLILEQTADETAALEDNTDTAAAKMSEFEARGRELQEELGQALLPILEENTDEIIAIFDALGELLPVVADTIGLVLDLSSAFEDSDASAGELIDRFRSWNSRTAAQKFDDVYDAIKELLGPIGEAIRLTETLLRLLGVDLPGITSPIGAGGGRATAALGSGVSTGPGSVTPSGGGGGGFQAFAGGGRVPGPLGKPMPAIVHGGETISGIGGRSGGGGGPTIVIEAGISDPLAIARAVVDALQLYEQNVGPVPIGLGEI